MKINEKFDENRWKNNGNSMKLNQSLQLARSSRSYAKTGSRPCGGHRRPMRIVPGSLGVIGGSQGVPEGPWGIPGQRVDNAIFSEKIPRPPPVPTNVCKPMGYSLGDVKGGIDIITLQILEET